MVHIKKSLKGERQQNGFWLRAQKEKEAGFGEYMEALPHHLCNMS